MSDHAGLSLDWPSTALGKVCRVEIGGTPSRSVGRFWADNEEGYPWAAISDLGPKWIEKTSESITQAGVDSSNVKRVPKGTVLMSFKLTLGRVGIAGVDLYTNEAIAAFYPDQSRVSAGWLYYILPEAVWSVSAEQAIKGQTLNKAKLANLVLLLPPVSEQQQIAEILDTADEAIRATERVIAKLKMMKQGLLHDLLTRGLDENGELRDPERRPESFKDSPMGIIPVHWDVCPIEEKLQRIIDYRGKTPEKTVSGVPLLTAKNVREGYLDPEPREYIAEEHYEDWMRRGIPREGDVLFTTEAPLGNVARMPGYRAALAQRLLTLCTNPGVLHPGYLFWLLLWPYSRQRLERLSTGSTVLGIKQSMFRKVLFQFPPIGEQQAIAAVLETHDARIRAEEAALAKLRQAKRGLMDDLLTGRVRVGASKT